jgi:hypothetical protein
MLTKQKLLQVLLGLKETNSTHAIHEPEFLTEICVEGDAPLVLRMFAIVNEMVDAFDYTKSPEFLRSVGGKSSEVRAMRLKLINPVRKKELRKRFREAMDNVLQSDEILDLVEPVRVERIKELRNLLCEVSNPNESNS